MEKNKNSFVPRLRFQEFSGEWEERKLGKVASIVNTKVGDKDVTLFSIDADRGLITQLEKFGRIIAGKSTPNYYLIQKGDFAYNKSATKAYPQGQISVLETHEEGAVPNSIFTCFRFKDLILPNYAKFLFMNNTHGKWIADYIEVGARAHGALAINNKTLLQLPIPFPANQDEQQRIANTLSSLDRLIESEQSKLEQLQEHKKGLMQNLFPQEGETMPKFRFKEFENDGEWEEVKVEDLFYLQDGFAFPSKHFIDSDCKSKQVIRITDINNKNKNSDKVYIDNIKEQELGIEQYKVSMGDLLLSLTGAAGFNFFIWDADEAYINQRTMKIIPLDKANRSLLYILEPLIHTKINNVGTGQNNNLSKVELSGIIFLIPSKVAEQQKIADTLSSLDQLISAQTERIELLQEHKKGLMQGMFPVMEHG